MKKYWITFTILFISLIGNVFFVNRMLRNSSNPQNVQNSALQNPFLSPRIFATNQNDILINFVDLRSKLQKYAASTKDSVAVYFEYLPSGVSIGVNDRNAYVLVSLLKTPVVMAVYKKVEGGKINLSDSLTIQQEDLDNKFGKLWQKGAGTQITVKQAILLTLADSDNTAKNALGHLVSNDDILDVFNSLDIPQEVDGTTPVVSPKNYSSVLRCLYLSCYLTKQYSNLLLDDMTKSNFDDKIAKPIPNDIPVAHKIGVHDLGNGDTPVFSDCGIIYLPHRPYILCIMTKTTDDKAKEYMQNISKLIYDYVKKANE